MPGGGHRWPPPAPFYEGADVAFPQVAGSSGANVHGSDGTTHNINFTARGHG